MGAQRRRPVPLRRRRASRSRWRVLGELRNQLGAQARPDPERPSRFLWVTRFPMFECDAESGALDLARTTRSRRPSTGASAARTPTSGALASRAYDLVLNGWELGSGSVRIHRATCSSASSRSSGSAPRSSSRSSASCSRPWPTARRRTAASRSGLDRTVALTLGLDNIRDVIAFPKTTSAADLMCGAPSAVARSSSPRSTSRRVVARRSARFDVEPAASQLGVAQLYPAAGASRSIWRAVPDRSQTETPEQGVT